MGVLLSRAVFIAGEVGGGGVGGERKPFWIILVPIS